MTNTSNLMNDSTILVMTTTATPVNASGNTTNRDQEEDDYKNEKETSINTNEKDDVEATTTTNKEENTSKLALFQQKCIQFYWVNEFLILVVIVICLAKAYPPLGAEYLYPQITATWMAVIFIFFMAGLSLQTAELSKSFQRVYFNITVQVFNFCIVSGIVFGVATLLETSNILSKDLASGMIICSCLPITINMVMVLSIASGGDEAAAIFHAAVGNMLGVVVSPALILLYIGASANLNVGEVFLELLLRVIVPVIVGQVIQKLFQQVVAFVKTHKHLFKQTQQYTLVYIVYTVFCRTFAKQDENDGGTIGDIFLMILFQFLLLSSLMALSWFVLKFLYPNQPRLRVMGLYGCTHKSVATGIPLIDAIYGTYRAVGLYTLPVLVWHPMQLLLGTILSPYLARWVLAEQKRLNLNDRDIPLTSILSEDADDDENANQPPTTTNIVADEEQQQRQDEVEEQPVPKISLIHEKDQ